MLLRINLPKIGIHTIADFRLTDEKVLEKALGHRAQQLLRLANGVDDRKVIPEIEAKSISRETTFVTDIQDFRTLESSLMHLTEDVAARLRRKGMFTRTVGIKLRFANFRTITREKTHAESTNITQPIWKSAQNLLHNAIGGTKFRVRLIGVHLQSLVSEHEHNNSLFNRTELNQQSQVDSVVDSINERFGKSTVHRGIASDPSKN